MVSITLSVPEDVRHKMDMFPEINWSGFVRKSIEEKVERLARFEKMQKDLEKERPIIDWSVKLQHSSRSGRLDILKKKGLI